METKQLHELVKNPGSLNNETADQLRKLTEEFPWFQMAWILYAKNLKLINSPLFDLVVKNVAVRIPNRKLFFTYLNSEIKKQEVQGEAGKTFSFDIPGEGAAETSGDSLIDKFLLKGTTGIRRTPAVEITEENEDRVDILEKSTAENDELITETLANIYFQQKKYGKAIHAYQKLSLKYPEKSVYFATRIKEIVDLKNIN